MRKSLFLIIFTLLITNSFSQNYIPLIKIDKLWDVVYNFYNGGPCMCSCYGYRYIVGEDTIINDARYSKINMSVLYSPYQPYGPFCPPYYADTTVIHTNRAVREDTLSKKVFLYDYLLENEYLLYDFSLSVGDTFTSEIITYGETLTLQSIDSIQLNNGQYAKKFNFDYYESSYYVEGIGSYTGIFEGILPVEYPSNLYCIQDPNSNLFWDCYGLININKNKKSNIQIYPNPSKDLIRLTGLNCLCKLTIINEVGIKVYEDMYFNEEKVINISKFPNGIYIVIINFNNENNIVKIIKN